MGLYNMNLNYDEQSRVIVRGIFETISEVHQAILQFSSQGFCETGITLISHPQLLSRVEVQDQALSERFRKDNQDAWLVSIYANNTDASKVEEIFREVNAIKSV